MPPTTTSDPRRHLPLEGTYNVRDIGGYPTHDGRTTRWGMLFRADNLHRLTPDGQTALLERGVRTVLDLRRSDELQAAPDVFATVSHVQYRHLSLLTDSPPVARGNPAPLVETYRRILDERQDQVSTVLSALAAPGGLPAIVHCTAGKDRTGVIVALMLALAGVPAATIVADYALTAMYLGGEFMQETRQRILKRGYTWEQYQPLVTCPPENMQTTLRYLDETYGGVEPYLRRIGLHEEQISRLQQALVA